MKATELQLGDWVYNTLNRKPEQVAEIRELKVMLDYNDLYDYDDIEPIPLTAEILEANGFVMYSESPYFKKFDLRLPCGENDDCDSFFVDLYIKANYGKIYYNPIDKVDRVKKKIFKFRKSYPVGLKLTFRFRSAFISSSSGNGWEWNTPNPRWNFSADGQWLPTQSPIHRGHDGISIRLDNLTIPFPKWRNESIKAYGNAIVPQVMYEIFRAIEQVENK